MYWGRGRKIPFPSLLLLLFLVIIVMNTDLECGGVIRNVGPLTKGMS